jgi:hypothetical protein
MRIDSLVALLLLAACRRPTAEGDQVSAARATDAVAIAIMAHRATYSTAIVERLTTAGVVTSTPDYDGEHKRLPLPVQFLRLAGEHVASTPQAGRLSFKLVSVDAINKKNLPQDDFEKAGLAAIARDPASPYRQLQRVNERRVFASMYADKAVSVGCVECHNAHPESPRHDYKLSDVMGALVVTMALDE